MRCLGVGAALGVAGNKAFEALEEDPHLMGRLQASLPAAVAQRAPAKPRPTVSLVRMAGSIEAPQGGGSALSGSKIRCRLLCETQLPMMVCEPLLPD